MWWKESLNHDFVIMMVYHLFQQLWLDVENSHLVGEKLYNHNLCEILYYLYFLFKIVWQQEKVRRRLYTILQCKAANRFVVKDNAPLLYWTVH